jgi:hypothetical protein
MDGPSALPSIQDVDAIIALDAEPIIRNLRSLNVTMTSPAPSLTVSAWKTLTGVRLRRGPRRLPGVSSESMKSCRFSALR